MRALQHYFIIAVVSALLLSCGKKKTSIPEGVLTQQEMTGLLRDLYIAQAAVNVYETTDSVKYSLSDYSSFILRQNKITKEKYTASIKFYTDHPEMMEEVYQEVIKELNKMQGETMKK